MYMPDEYRDGYICELLQRKHDGGKIKFFSLDKLREPDLCRRMFSVRTAMAVPMANDPPFATLNHSASNSGIPASHNHRGLVLATLHKIRRSGGCSHLARRLSSPRLHACVNALTS